MEQDTKIGGQGIVVEIDETKLGKRKYNRGHHVEGVWVLVGIERTPEGRFFLTPIEKRDQETSLKNIYDHVHEGSIIYTDCWPGYNGLSGCLGFEHSTVNHSQAFKSPINGACTNTAEGLNNGLKMKIMPRNRAKEGIEEHLSEYIWRELYKNNLFDSFISALRDIHYDF